MDNTLVDYTGAELTVRDTNRGRFQVLPVGYTREDMTRAPVFPTRAEAEAYCQREKPTWVADEEERQAARAPYYAAYAAVLARPAMREMRRDIQDLYQRMCWENKLAGAHQRAAARATGQISCMGRDIAAVRQAGADEQASAAGTAAQAWLDACGAYELALQQAMHEAGIPIDLFRSPVLIQGD